MHGGMHAAQTRPRFILSSERVGFTALLRVKSPPARIGTENERSPIQTLTTEAVGIA